MTDTITLPRAVAELVQDLIDDAYNDGVEELEHPSEQTTKALNALFAALAEPEPEPEPEPEQKPEPVAFTRKEWSPDCGEYVEFRTAEEMKFYDRADWTPLYAAPPAAAPSEDIDALRQELAAVLSDWNSLVRASGSRTNGGAVGHVAALRREAERYRWLRGEHSRIDPCIKANAKYKLERQSSTWVEIHDLDAAIDAAMGDKT